MDSVFYLQIKMDSYDYGVAKGNCDYEYEHGKIKHLLFLRGYKGYNIDITYDDFKEVWRFTCSIVRL